MNAVTFDTLKFARTLQEKGDFSPEQSATLVEALGDVLTLHPASQTDLRETEGRLSSGLRETELRLRSDLRETELKLQADLRETELKLQSDLRETQATLQSDLRETQATLQSDLRESELRLEAKLSETKADTVKWLFGVVGFQTVVVLGAVVALARVVH